MKILIFDIEAEYAHFKSYETTRGNYSFPFPPRTAILGLIAGILGIPRNIYWEHSHPLRYAKIALEVVNKVERYGLKVNYTRTREYTSIGYGPDRVILHFPSKPTFPDERGFITQVRLDLLKNVYYRVYCSLSETLLKNLVFAIKNRYFVYPPYLGHANLLAQVKYLDLIEGEPIQPKDMINLSGIVPISSLSKENPLALSGSFNIVYNVPYSQAIHTRHKRIDGTEALITKTDAVDNFIFQTLKDESWAKVNFSESALVVKFNLGEHPRTINRDPWNKLAVQDHILAFWPVSPSISSN